MTTAIRALVGVAIPTVNALAGNALVNWESPHVSPLGLTPDGNTLLAVNTADNRLEIFDVTLGTAMHLGTVPVGLDPVSVRARTNTEAWVVNHVSDSVSVVNLTTRNVVATLRTADEPCDVVFAGSPPRAFVSCSQVNTIQVFDPADLSVAPTGIPLDAEDPRSMAVSTDGNKIYAAVFESGNRSTILAGGSTVPGFFPPNAVSDLSGPYAGQNPPPNAGAGFNPPMKPGNPPPPPVGLIVKKNSAGRWMDDNGGDWTDLVSGPDAGRSGRPVGWDLLDHDVAVIDATTLEVTYVRGLMNLCMAVAVNPATNQITVVGTEALNEIRFEPNLNGRFLRVHLALVDPDAPSSPSIVDLNPHLTYTEPTVEPALREQSIGDPRGIAWNAAGTPGYVSGLGSNNVVVIDAGGTRAGLAPAIEVGEGPTGLALDEARGRLYVLNRFEASVSVVDTASELELTRVPFFDPTPPGIKAGRKHMFDTHLTSGLGHVACASCHPDVRMDRLAWDLGNPAGEVKAFNQNCNFGSFGDPPESLGPGPCPDWHPMKGPMVTQTLQDIIGKEPHHWRGDRDGLEEFNQTFTNLQGRPEMLTAEEMQEFEDFLASVALPPNPFRNFNNTLPTSMPLPGQFYTGVGGAAGQPLPNGNAAGSELIFNNHHLMPGFGVSCSFCHTLPTGIATNSVFNERFGTLQPFPTGPNGELHHAVVFSSLSESASISIKVPHLRNMHEKVGFDLMHTTSRAGFGFMHDGSVDTLPRFFSEPFFLFELGIDAPPSALIPGFTALLMAFSGSDLPIGRGQGVPPGALGPMSNDTHAAVGAQWTVNSANAGAASTVSMLDAMTALANAQPDFTPGPMVSLVARGVQGGVPRGYAYIGGGLLQSDRIAETIGVHDLRQSAADGAEITFTVVPRGTQLRIGIDRDADGFFDGDELSAGSDPADADSHPVYDADFDGDVDLVDFDAFRNCLAGPLPGELSLMCRVHDADSDNDVDLLDCAGFQRAFTGP